ncbi:serine-threonine protein kinase-like protein [Angomonas deanei]|uniref:Protein kinase domain/Protein tyrosine kinase, putative n=1 Tax=Angomonas deanei TaxID=59799 RepID=A0A7G2CLD0_9TRYP|nr:serine-threonine protein kinase-like protein [Angomonas deanei]CAD2220225.1 Protein kinase domain/Protein tyrosine kinase, putative [Angomonas deanei]|eukprot:EPY32552.1 serine-threonine protein kinase-like protein [Angomonas deanei]
MNAGARYTKEYNLSFVFLPLLGEGRLSSLKDFIRGELEKRPLSPAGQSKSSGTSTQKKANSSRARYLLTKARWDIASVVYRIYRRQCEAHYQLDTPLGSGGFGTVYSGALAPVDPSVASQCEAMLAELKELLLKGEEADLTALRERYVEQRSRMPPPLVSNAIEAIRRQEEGVIVTGGNQKRRRDPEEEGNPSCFAVKVIQKKKLLTFCEDRQDDAARVRMEDGRVIAMTREKEAVLRDLIALETQPTDRGVARECDLLSELKARVENDTHGGPTPDGMFFSPSLNTALEELRRNYYNHDEEPLAEALPQDVNTQDERERKLSKEAKRAALLSALPESVRYYYEKHIGNMRRQQGELQILLSVQHKYIIKLYEMFEERDKISIVMEKATGADAYTLLSPPVTGAAIGDVEGLLSGGPLCEFLVKIIIKQLLTAVLYLHTRGIVHRDLKLENILLSRSVNPVKLCTSQVDVLKEKLRNEIAKEKRRQEGGHTSGVEQIGSTKITIPNPLSVCHYCHLPTVLWPSIKLTDFGLSHILGNISNPADADSGDKKNTFDFEELVYSKQEMKTSCGTPIYAAPEILHKNLRKAQGTDHPQAGYTGAVDLYSVGGHCVCPSHRPHSFPTRRTNTGHTTVDYTRPIDFNRWRKNANNSPNNPNGGGQPTLPRLAVVDSVNVVPPTDGGCTWETDMRLLSDKIRHAEQLRLENNNSGGGKPGSVYLSTLEASLKALENLPLVGNQFVDVERLLWRSQQATSANIFQPNATTATSNAYGLPPVSKLGQDFILSLLRMDSSQRPTARAALSHPWLWELRGHD